MTRINKQTRLFLSIALAALLLIVVGCEKDTPFSPIESSEMNQSFQSNSGAIRILSVDLSKQIVESSTRIQSFNRIVVDSTLFYKELYCEFDHDEELKLSDGLTGESKVKLEKFTLPANMTVIFEWGGGDIYDGQITSREFGSAVTLNQPAFIRVSYKEGDLTEVDENTIGLYQYDETNSDWEALDGTTDLSNKRVDAYINRFGKLKLFHIKDGIHSEIKTINDIKYQAKRFIEAHKGAKLEVEGPDLDKSYVEFKEYDLPADMTVTFKWADGERFVGTVTCIEAAYQDAIFNNPVKIRVSYKNAQLVELVENNLDLFMYNPSTEEWEALEGIVNLNDNEIDATITRFGEIAIFSVEDGFLYYVVKLGENVFYDEKYIKATKGGTIQVGNKEAGKSKIKFKKHDLPLDMNIKFEWAANGTVDGLLNNMEFGPHGLFFNDLVEVELSYKMADLTGIIEDSLAVYYYHEDTGMWEKIGGFVDKGKKKIKVYLKHFSRYAIAFSR
jgi:hypothetical protein